MAIFPSVTAYKDGYDQRVEAAVLNIPINQLKERTDYLREKIEAVLSANPFESVRLASVPLNTTDTPSQWSVVYLEPGKQYYSRALSAAVSSPTYAYSMADSSSFAVGLLTSVSGFTGTLALAGKVSLSGVPFSTLLETGESFRDGPYYLSTREAGKITANPKGMAVFIGSFYKNTSYSGEPTGGFALLAPQLKDFWEAHLHRNFALMSQPSGWPVATGSGVDDTWTVRGFRPDVAELEETSPGVFDFVRRWKSGTVYEIGSYIVPPAATDNFKYYKCVGNAGDKKSSATTEPDWGAYSPGDSITDNNVTWKDMGAYPLLRFKGQFTGTEGTTYTIKWTASDAGAPTGYLIAGSTLTMSADNGSEADSSLDVEFYEKDYSFGPSGLTVAVEKGGDMADWGDLDFTVSYDIELDADSPANSWTMKVPDRMGGWRMHSICGTMSYTGTNTREYVVTLFGTYVSPDGRGAEKIVLLPTADGNWHDDAVGVSFEDINGDTICNETAEYGKVVHVLDSSPEGDFYDLWALVVMKKADGTGLSSTDMDVETWDGSAGDRWEYAFSDEASNARFEYCVGFDRNLSAYYPPTPLLGVVLELNGVTMDSRGTFAEGKGTYSAGYHSIYWYDDLYASAPWPSTWMTHDGEVDDRFAKNMMVYTAGMRLGQAGIVTSMAPVEGSGITIVDRNTKLPATTGDLEISASLAISSVATDQAGYRAFKTLNSQGQLVSGPVVEKLVPGAGISLTSTGPAGQGVVTVNADASGLMYGDFDSVMLLNAKQEIVTGTLFPYIKLLPWTNGSSGNVPSGFIGTFRVPYSLVGTYRVMVYMTMFGPNDVSETDEVQYAGLRVTYSVAKDFSVNGVASTDPFSITAPEQRVIPIDDDIAIGCSTCATKGYTAYDLFLVHNDPSLTYVDGQVLAPFGPVFPEADYDPSTVSAGNIVSVMVERKDVSAGHVGGPEYGYAVGFASLKWKLTPV